MRSDARAHSPRLAYDGFAPAAPRRPSGDVAARLELRAIELEATCDVLDDLLAGPVRARDGGAPRRPRARSASGASRARAARRWPSSRSRAGGSGALRLRTGSYANWPALAHAAAGNLLPDFPLINKSFELCYACVDR